MHLSDEQFEEALLVGTGAGATPPPLAEHLAACAACRDKLQAHQAVQARTREAFVTVRADPQLARRIREALARQKPTSARPPYIRFMPALAAVAAALIIALPLIVYLLSAGNAQAQLTRIHQDNLLAHHAFFSQDDPAKLAEYFKSQLGFAPAMPRPGQGLAMRGCCVAHFGNGVAGSYVVDTPSGPISVIVVRDGPEKLGLKDQASLDGRSYFKGSFGHCNLAALRLGPYTYCAVATAAVGPDKLIDLLGRLVS